MHVNDGISIIGLIEVLWNQELHCFKVLCKVTTAKCFKRHFSTNPWSFCLPSMALRSQLCLVCSVGWVHSCWVHFLWGCWNVILARKVYICIVIVPGRLCSGLLRQQNYGKCFPFLLTWVYSSLKAQHTVKFWILHLRDGVLFLLDVRGRGTAHARYSRSFVRFSTKLTMM